MEGDEGPGEARVGEASMFRKDSSPIPALSFDGWVLHGST